MHIVMIFFSDIETSTSQRDTLTKTVYNNNESHLTVSCELNSKRRGLSHLPPKFEHIFVAVITFPPLSSVQILLLPACCLLCVL